MMLRSIVTNTRESMSSGLSLFDFKSGDRYLILSLAIALFFPLYEKPGFFVCLTTIAGKNSKNPVSDC